MEDTPTLFDSGACRGEGKDQLAVDDLADGRSIDSRSSCMSPSSSHGGGVYSVSTLPRSSSFCWCRINSVSYMCPSSSHRGSIRSVPCDVVFILLQEGSKFCLYPVSSSSLRSGIMTRQYFAQAFLQPRSVPQNTKRFKNNYRYVIIGKRSCNMFEATRSTQWQ